MGHKLENISFEKWVAYIFDHLVIENSTEKIDAYLADSDWWDDEEQPLVTINYLTRLFENPISALEPYSDAQINKGLWSLISSSGEYYMMFVIRRADVPWSERQRCAEAMFTLFERLFAVRCTPTLSHLGEPNANPLNGVCYMWFDILPIYNDMGEPHNQQLEQVTLDVMRRILDLESIACQESALHGLNHWQSGYPDDAMESNPAVEIIDSFLKRHPDLRPELRAYALIARESGAQ
jgi:hypothetical protein